MEAEDRDGAGSMCADPAGVGDSLYKRLGQAVTPEEFGPPDTRITETVETIDQDVTVLYRSNLAPS
jgi:hypothetical protein